MNLLSQNEWAVPRPTAQQLLLKLNETRTREKQTILSRLHHTQQKLLQEQQWSRQIALRCAELEEQVDKLEKENAFHVDNSISLNVRISTLERHLSCRNEGTGNTVPLGRDNGGNNPGMPRVSPTTSIPFPCGASQPSRNGGGKRTAFQFMDEQSRAYPYYGDYGDRQHSRASGGSGVAEHAPFTAEQKRLIRHRLLTGRGPKHTESSRVAMKDSSRCDEPKFTASGEGSGEGSGKGATSGVEGSQEASVAPATTPLSRDRPYDIQHLLLSTGECCRASPPGMPMSVPVS